MPTILDLSTWNRREHFEFFRKFEEPFFGVTVEIDCTGAYSYCKSNNISFFLFYLHKCLVAANAVENFKYRIDGDQVVIHDVVSASPTIGREDGTFGFSYMDYYPDFDTFYEAGKREIERVRASTGLGAPHKNQNVIHCSAVPWLRFTSMSHARALSSGDSCPKISFGKIVDVGQKKMMPVSIHVHHGLMDAYHVGQFVKNYELKITNYED